MRFRFRFRVTLMTLLLVLLGVTAAALSLSSYLSIRSSAEDLSRQIVEQTSQRVDQQVSRLLDVAVAQGRLNGQLLQSGQYDSGDFRPLARYWLEVMRALPVITRMSLGLERDGDWFYVRRTPLGKLAVGELRRNPDTRKLELNDYWPEEYPRTPFDFKPSLDEEDPRLRQWYRAARQARRQVWSESYTFFGIGGVADTPGVSCVTPVFKDGKWLGAMTSSIGLYEICAFLKLLRVGETGFAFVVEYRSDGTRRVVAHPNRDILLRVVKKEGEKELSELVPPDQLPDARVRAFLDQLPDRWSRAESSELVPVQLSADGTHYLGGYRSLGGPGAPKWVICIVLPRDDVLGRVHRNTLIAVVIALTTLAVAALISLYVSGEVARPLERLAAEAEEVGHLRIQPRPVQHSLVLEVDRLAEATEDMKRGLLSFQKYVPADLVRDVLASGREAALGGERRVVTISFCDLANFTAISEKLTCEELVRLLGEYFQAYSTQIVASGGTVDKYIGDAIMAFWGAPLPQPRHALEACTAALRGRERMQELRQKWAAEGRPALFTRIGIHTGEVLVGNIGSPARLNYTVMGDAVNLASRLEGLNKVYGTDILLSESTYREAGPDLIARPLDWVSVKGKTEAVLVYELLGLRGESDQTCVELTEVCGRALQCYRSRDWAGAIGLFEQACALRSGDAPAQLLIDRCRAYQAAPPGPSWDGVHHMETK
jgi:adenylate cyclase